MDQGQPLGDFRRSNPWMQANTRSHAYGSIATWNFSNPQTQGFDSKGTLIANSGNAYASYLLGAVNSSSRYGRLRGRHGRRYRTYSGGFRITIRCHRNLTLNLGLRLRHHDAVCRGGEPHVVLQSDSSECRGRRISGDLMFAGNGPDSCGCRTNISPYYRMF